MSSAVELRAPGPRGIPPLFARLVDNASLFTQGANGSSTQNPGANQGEPASLPQKAAVAEVISEDLETRDGEFAGVLGLLLCQASRLPELITELAKVKPSTPVPLSLVCDTGLGEVPKALSIIEGRQELLNLRMVEMPAPGDVDDVWLERVSEFVPEDVIRVVEPRRGGQGTCQGWLESIQRVATYGCWPKLRCGGQTAESFPSIDVVAEFLSVACQLDVPFKVTAGMQHAVRNTNPGTGFTHHGFVNLLVATGRALSGKDVRAALGNTNGAELSAEASALSDEAAQAVRGVFNSFGTTTLSAPSEDLAQLGLL